MTKRMIRVLMIDNEKEFTFLSKANLEAAGEFKVTTIPDGYNGVILAERDEFDVILLDILMPAMNGFQILEKLKAGEKTRHIPVIIESALFDQESIERARSLGAHEYLVKPYTVDRLIKTIKSVLRKSR